MFVSAIILAAGESRRMGAPKQLLPFGAGTMLEAVLDTLLRSRANEVILVLGHRWEEIVEALHLQSALTNPQSVRVAVNTRYQDEMFSSVQCGLRELNPAAQAFLMALGDQPLVTPEVVNRLIAAFAARQGAILLPTFGGKRGHPALFDARYKEEILNMDAPTSSLKDVVRRHLDEVVEVAVDIAGVTVDVDDRSDYESALNLMRDSNSNGANKV